MSEITWSDIGHFLKSTSSRLALTYLAIIMLMSVGFSVVFYNASSRQLGRQLPPASVYSQEAGNTIGPGQIGPQIQVRRAEFDAFFQQRIDEGRKELLTRLVGLNIFALLLGGGLSYVLARRTLQPIEAAMEAQGRFISDASHELRTPITALQTTNEVALRKPTLNEQEARNLIQHNVAEAAKLKDLTDSLLGLLRSDRAKLSLVQVSFQDVVSDAMNQIVTSALSKGITIEDKVPDIKIRADPKLLARVVTILLDNAVKYSHDKSKITLCAFAKAGYGYLEVKDRGIGIRATDLPHIFDRFYRADRSRSKERTEGYGLGLSIAQKIVKQHHGEILARSQQDSGSTFTIKLPLAL